MPGFEFNEYWNPLALVIPMTENLPLNPELPNPATQAVYLKKGAALRTFKTVIEVINKNESKISDYN